MLMYYSVRIPIEASSLESKFRVRYQLGKACIENFVYVTVFALQ